MPDWKIATKEKAENDLDQAFAEIEEAVLDNPAFEDVTGVDANTMMVHAKKMLAHHLTTQTEGALHDPEQWIRVYVMGFVVGTKFGRRNTEDASTEAP